MCSARLQHILRTTRLLRDIRSCLINSRMSVARVLASALKRMAMRDAPCKSPGCETLLILKDLMANVDVNEKFEGQPLIVIYLINCKRLDMAILKAFVERGVRFNCQDGKGRRPLNMVISNADKAPQIGVQVIQFMLTNGADPRLVDMNNSNALHVALQLATKSKTLSMTILNILLETKIATDLVRSKTHDNGNNVLCDYVIRTCLQDFDFALFKKFASIGVSVNEGNSLGNTPLHALITRGVNCRNHCGKGCEKLLGKQINDFVAIGADPTRKNRAGEMPLVFAISIGLPLFVIHDLIPRQEQLGGSSSGSKSSNSTFFLQLLKTALQRETETKGLCSFVQKLVDRGLKCFPLDAVKAAIRSPAASVELMKLVLKHARTLVNFDMLSLFVKHKPRPTDFKYCSTLLYLLRQLAPSQRLFFKSAFPDLLVEFTRDLIDKYRQEPQFVELITLLITDFNFDVHRVQKGATLFHNLLQLLCPTTVSLTRPRFALAKQVIAHLLEDEILDTNSTMACCGLSPLVFCLRHDHELAALLIRKFVAIGYVPSALVFATAATYALSSQPARMAYVLGAWREQDVEHMFGGVEAGRQRDWIQYFKICGPRSLLQLTCVTFCRTFSRHTILALLRNYDLSPEVRDIMHMKHIDFEDPPQEALAKIRAIRHNKMMSTTKRRRKALKKSLFPPNKGQKTLTAREYMESGKKYTKKDESDDEPQIVAELINNQLA